MKSRKKASFMLLMVMLFVFLTACGSEKKEEPETTVITTEQTEEAMEGQNPETLTIQSVKGWIMEEEFPYEIKLYDRASEALEHASDNKLVALAETEGRVNLSYSMIGRHELRYINNGRIVQENKVTGSASFPTTTGDIQTVSIRMERELDGIYEVVYEVQFKNRECYEKYIAFQIE